MPLRNREHLNAPPIPDFAVPRRHLSRQLDAAVAGSALTLVVAPPGFGKSVALAAWAAEHTAPVAWLALERADNDAVAFATHLVGALGHIDPGVGAAALERLEPSGRALGDPFLHQMIDEMRLLPTSTVVLDDLDTVSNRALLNDIAVLIEHAGPVRMVVAARADPALPLQRLRVLDQIAYLRQRDLVLDADEAVTLTHTLSGHLLSEHQADALVTRTEGWPAGLVMAAIALRGADDIDHAVERFAGMDENVAGYLTDAVLARQPPDVQRFLYATSVLERLSGSLCDAVTGGHDGHAMVDWLERQSLFVTRLDPSGEWFRYHRLFRDLLQHRLRASGLDQRAFLGRAADWHLERDDAAGAAGYLIAAEDWERVLALVDDNARSLFEHGHAATALRWLDAVPRSMRAARRDMGFKRVSMLQMSGMPLAAEEELHQLEVASPFTVGEQLFVDVTRANWVLTHLTPDAALAAGARALETLASGAAYDVPDTFRLASEQDLRAMVRISMARAHFYQGDSGRARTELASVHTEEVVTYAPWLVHLLGAQALVEVWDGELRRAEELAVRALSIAREAELTTHPASVDAHLAMAHTLMDRGEHLRADLVLSEVAAHVQRVRRSVPLAFLTTQLASLALAQGEHERGMEHLARHRQAGHPPVPPALAAALRAVELRLLVQAGEARLAERFVSSDDDLWTSDLVAAALEQATSAMSIPRARKLLEAWPATASLRSRLQLGLWSAVVADLDGDRRAARTHMADVVALAEPEGHLRLFQDAGRDALRVVRALFESEPTPFLRRIVQPERPVPARVPSGGNRLVEPLSERERIVLSYLPSRLSNAEIAQQLYISLNTLKTHLRHVYRKLGVRGRGEAIVAAEQLHLV